jgi:predicted unusual protein kinase regulating ubiquinone biosynthesis (AarF/ABC1/UbiB family)
MKKSILRRRYWRILFFFARVISSFIGWDVILPRLGMRSLSNRTRPERYRRIAGRFRLLAIAMGGVMIKVGQFLSTRLDVLPAEIIDELSGLQDEVPAEPMEAICALAEEELGVPVAQKFASFDETPLAAASFGQVHRACLLPGDAENAGFEKVVVKIQRPDIEQLVETDLSALKVVGGWLQRYRPIRKRANVPALVEELSTTVRAEIDYLAEGRNAETFAANFRDDARVHVPRVVWSNTTRRVLVLEDVFAIKITDYEAISAAGIERKEVAERLLATYLKQIFEDGFFHADPHPGNLFVSPLEEPNPDGSTCWRLTFVDFGMVGRMPENLFSGLRELVIAVGLRDSARLVRSYQTLGILLPGANTRLIEEASQQVFDRFWGMDMSELRNLNQDELVAFTMQFRELLFEMPFQLPENLLFLGRAVSILSGMCTGLQPDFNVWAQVAPFTTRLAAEEGTSRWNLLLDGAGEFLKILVGLPGRTDRVLGRMERGELNIQVPQVSFQIGRLERSLNRLTGAILFLALLLSGAVLYASNEVLGLGLMGASIVAFLYSLFMSRPRHPW